MNRFPFPLLILAFFVPVLHGAPTVEDFMANAPKDIEHPALGVEFTSKWELASIANIHEITDVVWRVNYGSSQESDLHDRGLLINRYEAIALIEMTIPDPIPGGRWRFTPVGVWFNWRWSTDSIPENASAISARDILPKMPRSIVNPSNQSETILGPWYFSAGPDYFGEGPSSAASLFAPANETELENAGYFIPGVGLTASGINLCRPDPIAGLRWNISPSGSNGYFSWDLFRPEAPDPEQPSPVPYFAAAQHYNRKINALTRRGKKNKASRILRRQNTLLQKGISLFN